MQFLPPKLVVVSESIDLLLLLRDRAEELRVGRFTGQEFLDDFLNIGVTSGRTDLLESIFILEVLFHFFFHFGLEEGRPELLSEEVLLHLKLI